MTIKMKMKKKSKKKKRNMLFLKNFESDTEVPQSRARRCALVRLWFASKTPNCDMFYLSACSLVSLLFVFFSPLFARLVLLALWLLSRRKETAVVYHHRGVTSISKPFHVVTWICHAMELQLSNEACAIQQEVRRKSTQELLR